MDLELTGKYVLVTGSNRGTGQAIAARMANEGASVFIHSQLAGDSEKTVAQGAAGIAVWGDITTDEGADQVFAQVRAHTDRLSILVNNLGAAANGTWTDSTIDDWHTAYEFNTLTAVRMVKKFMSDLIASGSGRIINVGTIGSTRPNARMPHYYAAKGALANLTVSLAKELAGTGVTVNLVSPGLIRTPEVETAYLKRAQREGWGDTFDEAETKITEHYFPNPTGRIATREEVADVIVFLASVKAAFINAQNIRVDGGAVDIV